MTHKIAIFAAAAALALTPLAGMAQTQNQGASDQDSHMTMQKQGKVQKQTDPHKNGTSQSESTNGANKNGQPQKY